MKELTDACYLALLGQAVGDAFGAPFEYNRQAPELAELSMNEGRYLDSWDDCGQRKVKFCRLPGLYTDDTQQALALIKAWLETDTPADAAAHFKATCLAMARHGYKPNEGFGVHRGTGGNFRQAVMTGEPVDTAGLGAPMRVGPVATLFENPQEMVDWILEVSKVTTTNAVSLASTVKFAAVAWVLSHHDRREEIRNVEWPTEIASEVWTATSVALRIMKVEGEQALLDFAKATGWANKEMRCAANGFALTGFAWAIERSLTAPDFGTALVRVCGSGGDTDTVAAMAGCLAALKFGTAAIPDWMTENLVGRRFVLNPVKWHPIEVEAELTKLDDGHRDLAAKKSVRAKKVKKESREVLDMFALAEEAYAAEEPLDAPVLFYGQNNYLGEFSNFYLVELELDGETWASVEHYYMAQKNPDDAEFQVAIRKAKTGWVAKTLGRAVELRDGWDDIKYDLMFRAVRAKFEQHPNLAQTLLDTGDRDIHEDCKDPWWGGGPNFPNGRDWLGAILMDVRDLLRG